MWACPKAQDLWRQLLAFWSHVTTALSALHSDSTTRAIFRLRMASPSDRLWQHTELTRLGKPAAVDTAATALALQAAWQRQALLTFHVIWRWRTAADTPDEIWPYGEALSRHRAGLQAVRRDLRWDRSLDSQATKFTAAALDVLFSTDESPQTLSLDSSSVQNGDSYLLFFDGGSRGNPGPGGSGAVVVRVNASTTNASVVWSAAMALSNPRTTNNQAEYVGLLTGLKAAHAQRWMPLAVVGDSQLILNQMAEYKPPKTITLLQHYADARRLANQLRVTTWRHHYRAFNKMADAAANAAMDATASSQAFHPTDRREHVRIADHLASDFAQWQEVQFGT